MTEAEWLALPNASKLLAALPAGASARKLRLFVCGCWRMYHRNRTEAPNRRIRGKSHLAELLAAVEAGDALADGAPPLRTNAEIWYATMADVSSAARGTSEDRHLLRRRIPTGLLRDIFGNPFRPVVADPSWLTSDVLALAKGIYEERAFDRMPILADALQDAGCDNDDVLAHCRSATVPHVRGCWVVDVVLGKA